MSRYRIEICCEPKRGHYWRLCRRDGTETDRQQAIVSAVSRMAQEAPDFRKVE
jgi:hypothetical protein